MSPSRAITLHSKGEINRCGRYLADLAKIENFDEWQEFWDPQRAMSARTVVSDFRAAHQRPLGIVSEGLRKIVRSELGTDPVVSQRLKRLPRIVRKLGRMESTLLARLEDIGGCRAVLANADEQEAVRAHLERTWSDIVVRRRDYIAEPNDTGYRALHFVIEKYDRRIEVQLRTIGQQRWANAIEAADSRLGLTLKDGVGPASMLEYFSAVGTMFYHQENHLPIAPELSDRYDNAVDLVIAEGYYSRRNGS